MFCRKCGAKLLPDDVFCSNCGTKVINETSTDEPTHMDNSQHPTQTTIKNKFLNNSFFKFLIYFFSYVLLVIFIYAIFPIANMSLPQFISSPNGLMKFLGIAVGAALVPTLCSLPLFYALKKMNKVERLGRLDIFFFFMLLIAIGIPLKLLPPIEVGLLIVGIILQIFFAVKKHR